MRILQACPYDLSARGGVQTHIAQLSRALEVRGHELRILGPSRVQTHSSNVEIVGRPTGVPFNGSMAPICFDPRAFGLVRRAVERFEPDIVHVHEPFSSLVSLMTVLCAQVPVVATFHSGIDRPIERWVYGRWARVLVNARRRLDRCIAVSSVAAETARLVIDHVSDIVPNGTDFIRPRGLVRVHGREEQSLLFVGRLDRRKGFAEALDAFRLLLRSGRHLRLVVVGDGPERVWVDRLEPAVRAHVQMLGNTPREHLRRLYDEADVFVAPATGGESFGMVVLDALASGCPVVASDIPGYRDLLGPDYSDMLVPAGDVQALADKVTLVLNDSDLSSRMSRAGAARGREFAWHRVAQRIDTIYCETLGLHERLQAYEDDDVADADEITAALA